MNDLKLAHVNHFTLAKHHLTPDTRTDDLVQIAGDVGGLHATGVTTPYLSLWARTRRFKRDDLDRELYERRTLAKLRCVRNTVYVHPRHVIPFVFKATVGMAIKGSEQFLEARGVSPAQFSTTTEAIVALLQDREMTASAIKEALHTELDVSAVLNLLCDQGVLIRARPEKSWRDRRQNYALLADYFPDLDLNEMDEKEAVRLLVRHYLAAFGPATENDIVWWMGLGKRQVQEALADLAERTTQVTIAELDGEFIALGSELDRMHGTPVPDRPVVNLLPVQDPYIMGYKGRARYLDERHRDLVFDRFGNGTSAILVSGRVAGVWDAEDGPEPTVKLFLFHPANRDVREAIDDCARALGRFIFEQEAKVRQCVSMTLLTERTAGGMMSPLKGCPLEDADG